MPKIKKKKCMVGWRAALAGRAAQRRKSARAESRAVRTGNKVEKPAPPDYRDGRSNALYEMQSSPAFMQGAWYIGVSAKRNGPAGSGAQKIMEGSTSSGSEVGEKSGIDLQAPVLQPRATALLQAVWDAIVPFKFKTNGLGDAMKEVRSLLLAALISSHSFLRCNGYRICC